ncbi:MAG: hypothetical protein P8106_11260, partial [Gammaproteobacteria bacterium]
VIWVGSDDGLVHLSRDDGASWTDVSPPHRGEAMINAIELSPHAPGVAYLAVTGYKLNDFSPYIYRTTDYGRRWQRIDRGLPGNTFVRVVREDPQRKGQLYAGTEAGMFVSFDDGGHWHSLALNLPPVPITDLAIRQDSLVAATQGRGFWVLDDLFMVRAAAGGIGDEAVEAFAAADNVLFRRRGGSAEDFEAPNPPSGARIYYYLGGKPAEDAELTIEILDAAGHTVRRFSSMETEHERCLKHNEDPRRPYEPSYPKAAAGLNQWDWRGDRDPFPCIRDMTLFAGLEGPRVLPGSYRARVSIDGRSAEVPIRLREDPRIEASPEETREWAARIDETAAVLDGVLTDLAELRAARDQLLVLMGQHPDEATLLSAGQVALDAIEAWDHQVIQPLHETYEDEDAWETMLAGQLRFLLDVIRERADRGHQPQGARAEHSAYRDRRLTRRLAAFNRTRRRSPPRSAGARRNRYAGTATVRSVPVPSAGNRRPHRARNRHGRTAGGRPERS